MRRALLATLLCAAPLAAAPAHAAPSLQERQALRAVLQAGPHSATRTPLPLPLPPASPSVAPASPAATPASIASSPRRERVFVGVRAHSQLPGLRRTLESLGARTRSLELYGVIAATVPSGRVLATSLAGDPRVAYVERQHTLRASADPYAAIDPETGVSYTWFYEAVRTAEALAAAGGGSLRTVAVIDTGVDAGHPDLAGRLRRGFDTSTRQPTVTDFDGHGTFVSGLIAAVDGNGIGGRGVGGSTGVIPIRASLDGNYGVLSLVRGITHAIRREADVVNLSMAGPPNQTSPTLARALAAAYYNDLLPVAASGNNGDQGNVVQVPAALVGAPRGATGIGLSVGATRPDGTVAEFSTHNRYVSLVAPGAGPSGCAHGVLSTIPHGFGTSWDGAPGEPSCSRVYTSAGARYAYAEGTSASAPIVAGIAALTWQIEPRLASEQVAKVLMRSARQIRGERRWNEFSGTGIVDGAAATALAAVYDVTDPRARGRARRVGDVLVRARVRRTRDRTEAGRELAGGIRYGLVMSLNGGRSFPVIVSGRRRPFTKRVRLRGKGLNVLLATACDSAGNCGVKRLGGFRAR